MKYSEILKELDAVNLKNKFTAVYELKEEKTHLKDVKKTNKLNSTATMIICLMEFLQNDSKEWVFWQKVLFYFLTPKFAKKKSQLPNE